MATRIDTAGASREPVGAADSIDPAVDDWDWAAKNIPRVVAGAASLLEVSVIVNATPGTSTEGTPMCAETTADSSSAAHFFDAELPPTIAVVAYLQRFVQFANPGVEGLILAVLLAERLCNKGCKATGVFRLTPRNLHRVVAAAVLVSGKLTLERYYSNVRVAKVAGLTVTDLNHLERAFLATLEYDLAFTAGQLAETLTRVREAASDN